MNMETHYTYNGYEYRTWDEIESDGDNVKTFHECWKDGKEVVMNKDFYNYTPYDTIPYDTFVRYVEDLQ
jgi:hypothetical protein